MAAGYRAILQILGWDILGWKAPMDSYRVKRMKEIAKEYSELIAAARRDTTKMRLREQALQAIEDVQMVDDFLQQLGVR